MPQPTGDDLAAVRARREKLRQTYLHDKTDRAPSTARGIHHAAFVCKDVEETIRFYQDFLGFPLVELVENRDYAGSSHFFFDLGNRTLLGFFDFPGHDHEAYKETIGALQHLAISVSAESFENAKAKLEADGVDYLGPDRGADDSLYFRDPNGMGIELYQEVLGNFEGTELLLMTGAAAEAAAAVLLALTLGFAVLRPRGLSEAVVALPAAALVVLLGIVPGQAALDTLKSIGPTVAFLAAILVFGHLCADAGVFDFLGSVAARAGRGNPTRLLALVVGLAAAITATLTLDATVVLLTPVVLATTARLKVPARPFAYACTRLANSGSLLLPVSNLTNLLAFGAAGLSFGRFTSLMVAPWVLVCLAEYVGLRTFFRADLRTADPAPAGELPPAPRYALVVLAITVALFVITSAVDVAPAWAALAGCIALLVPRVRARTVKPLGLVSAASPGFCVFVLTLAVIVDGVTRHGLGGALKHVIPSSTSFLALLGLAAVAGVLANVVNNLPATLVLVPLVSAHPAWVLAVLIGVNIGPNATYPGSLATLLWRRLLPGADKPRAAEFHLLGILTVPLLIVLATAALWLGTRTIGV